MILAELDLNRNCTVGGLPLRPKQEDGLLDDLTTSACRHSETLIQNTLGFCSLGIVVAMLQVALPVALAIKDCQEYSNSLCIVEDIRLQLANLMAARPHAKVILHASLQA